LGEGHVDGPTAGAALVEADAEGGGGGAEGCAEATALDSCDHSFDLNGVEVPASCVAAWADLVRRHAHVSGWLLFNFNLKGLSLAARGVGGFDELFGKAPSTCKFGAKTKPFLCERPVMPALAPLCCNHRGAVRRVGRDRSFESSSLRRSEQPL
jgi:hypothetical protein